MSTQTLPVQNPPHSDALVKASLAGSSADVNQITVELAKDSIVEVTLPPNTVIRSPEIFSAAEMVRVFTDGRKLPMLLTLTGVLSVTKDALLAYSNSVVVSAFALLGESPVDRVIAHYLLRAKPASVPARFFTSEAEARNWLRRCHLEA